MLKEKATALDLTFTQCRRSAESAEVGRSAASHSSDLSGFGRCAPASSGRHPLSWRGQPRDRFPGAAAPNFRLSSSIPVLAEVLGDSSPGTERPFWLSLLCREFIYLLLFYIGL